MLYSPGSVFVSLQAHSISGCFKLFDSLMPESCGSPALITHSKDNTAIKQEAARLGIELLMLSYRAQSKHRSN